MCTVQAITMHLSAYDWSEECLKVMEKNKHKTKVPAHILYSLSNNLLCMSKSNIHSHHVTLESLKKKPFINSIDHINGQNCQFILLIILLLVILFFFFFNFYTFDLIQFSVCIFYVCISLWLSNSFSALHQMYKMSTNRTLSVCLHVLVVEA